MKEEFTKYIVRWTFENEIKERVFYDKNKAMKWKYFIDKSDVVSNCVVKKITEITELIA